MTLLRTTTCESAREFCSRPARDPRLPGYQPAPLSDRLRITRRRTWWLGRIPVWRWTVAVLEMPILMPRAKAPPRSP